MHTPSSPPSRPRRGFTTVELMISLGVISLTMIGVVAFTYQALNVYAYDSGRLLVNHDIRKLTGDMLTDAVYSNYFRIYSDFATRDVYQTDGGTGDFLLLAYTDPATTNGISLVNELRGYYRDPDGTGVGPVRRFIAPVSPSAIIGTTTNTSATPNPIYTLTDLINAYAPAANQHTNPIVIQFAEGLATGKLFYNFKDHSVMIRSQIDELGTKGGMIRRAVNTYNFTVSPRG